MVPRFNVVWRLFITDFISVLVGYIIRFSVILISDLVSCVPPEIYPFLLDFLICWHLIVCIIPNYSLYFCGISCKSPFSSLIVLFYQFGSSSYFWLIGPIVYQFCLFLKKKNQLSISLIFHIAFVLYLVYFFSRFYYFLSSTNLEVALFLFEPLRCIVRSVILNLFYFLM